MVYKTYDYLDTSAAGGKKTAGKTPLELERERIAQKKAKRNVAERMDHPDLYAAIHREIRTRDGEEGPRYGAGNSILELSKARQHQAKFGARALGKHDAVEFVERGPGNVAGRTRIIIPLSVDPLTTWLSGSVGGGVWKTTDAGQTWTHLTEGLPNLATTTMAIPASNEDIIYIGTGESFAGDGINGSGMFKSTDGGQTWTLLEATTNIVELQNINRIIVDPDNPDYVVACGRQSNFGLEFASGIFVSQDGGITWDQQFEANGTVQQVVADPDNFDIQYAAIFGTGVWKSTDAGLTWNESTTGLSADGRIELAVAPSNTDVLYASVQGGLSGSGGSDMFVSKDAGATWQLLIEENDGVNIDHLGGQGGYDNCVTVNPYDENVVYAGGVNMFKFELTGASAAGGAIVNTFETDADFLGFVNFSGAFGGGALDIGSAFADNPLNVEVRFGPGETQLAYRFTVGDNGRGVQPDGYAYQDYVEVPFTVWDVDNERQLMVSFRDQAEDGAWELIEQNTEGANNTHSREYVFIHNVTYSETPDSNIAQDGSTTTGQEYEQVYFYWPVLTAGSAFDPENLPASTLTIETANIDGLDRVSTVISDAYSDFNSNNSFSNAEFESRVGGIHPDHHYVTTIPVSDADETFVLVVVNDGGVYYSETSDDPSTTDGTFNYAGFGYNTSQFYGADKRPGADEYIGGMQDNSTWFTKSGEVASATSQYDFAFGGDGFEAIWNKADSRKMIGSIQFNAFRKTEDGGLTWVPATSGHGDSGNGNGAPFISRLSNHPANPDRIYSLGQEGVWISEDFGDSWELSAITENYTLRGDNEVKISIADPNIVWTGGAMIDNSRIHVSTDAGQSFNVVPNYDEATLGSITGIATHPSDANTAYVLFSIAEGPKILRTTDLGQTWEDISGFGANATSDNGYPDVATYSLFVFPWNTDRIWAGTEIGIFESLDNGASWALLDCNMPATAVWQMLLVDDQVVIATHGRGIWTASFPEQVLVAPTLLSGFTSLESELSILAAFAEEFDSVEVFVDGNRIGVVVGPGSGNNRIDISLTDEGSYDVQLIGYLDGESINSNELSLDFLPFNDVANSYGSDLDDEPAGDFILNGFSYAEPTSFVNPSIHSSHPYESNINATALVRTPITVGAGENTLITYEDVAIVEPGLDGSVFGETAFFDYVVVEGTNDGQNWIALGDGYDATLDPSWLSQWNSGRSGTRTIYREQTINLLDYFSEGDVVAVRWRLFSDGGTEGWGYSVDNIYIQEEKPEEVTGLENEILNNQLGIEVYPVPANSSQATTIRYYLPQTGAANLRIMSLNGQVVEAYQPGVQPVGEYQYQMNNVLEPGIYLVQIEQGRSVETRKMVIR